MNRGIYKSIGILCNPLSGRIKGRQSRICELAHGIENSLFREASNPDEIEKVLKEFALHGIDLLVIIAGDGSIQAALTSIFNEHIFSSLPPMVFIPAGTTNMTAKEFYAGGNPESIFKRLLKKLTEPGTCRPITRAVLRIQNGDGKPQYGMFFGMGIIADAVLYFQKRVRATGITGERASAIVLFRYLFLIMSGKISSHVTGKDTSFSINGGQTHQASMLLLLATSLNRLLLGFCPYWGKQPEPIHFTAIRTKPEKLWRSILPLLLGKGERLSETDGYNSVNLSSMTLNVSGKYVIDGEVFNIDAANDLLHVSAEMTISVLDMRN